MSDRRGLNTYKFDTSKLINDHTVVCICEWGGYQFNHRARVLQYKPQVKPYNHKRKAMLTTISQPHPLLKKTREFDWEFV